MLIVAQDAGEEAVLKEVADTFVPPVEALRVHAVELVEAFREPIELRFDNEVVVIAHQAIGVTAPSPLLTNASHRLVERNAIGVVDKDFTSGNAPRSDVIHASTGEHRSG
jgi:hypothetical protein